MSSEAKNTETDNSLGQFPEDLVLQAIDESQEKGNNSFRSQEWDSAITHFTEALSGALKMEKRSKFVPALYRNRASAHFAKKEYGDSLKDAKTSLQIEPQNSKGNYLVGRALFALSNFKDASRYFGASLSHALKRHVRSSSEKEIADIEKWKSKSQQAWDKQIEAGKAEKERQIQLKLDQAITERTRVRHAVDYSRFDNLDDDDDNDDDKCEGEDSLDQQVVVEPSEAWHAMSKLSPFNRKEAECLREEILAQSIASGDGRELNSGSSPSIEAYKETYRGLVSLLTNLSILHLPQRRLRQLSEGHLLANWCQGIERAQQELATTNATIEWLVAGFGIGATLITCARAANHATFVGPDCSQPSLLSALRDTLTANGVRPVASATPADANSKTNGNSPSLAKGLSSLRKKPLVESTKCENVSSARSPVVHLLQGSLESLKFDSATTDTPTAPPTTTTTMASRFNCLALDPECFDASLLGHRVLPAIRHAHKEFLLANNTACSDGSSAGTGGNIATVFPSRGRVRGVVIELRTTPNVELACGVDLSAQGDMCGWSVSYEEMTLASNDSMTGVSDSGVGSGGGVPWKALTETFDVWDFNFADSVAMSALPTREQKSLSLRFTDSGRANALMTWVELEDNAGGNVVSSHPSNRRQAYWGQAVYWLPPASAAHGKYIKVVASRTDTTTKFEIKVGKSASSEAAPLSFRDEHELLIGNRFLSKVPTRNWEILGSKHLLGSCRDAITHSVRAMRKLRQAARAGGVHVLELQCGGTCALLSMLAIKAAGASVVIACDTDTKAVNRCRALANANGLLHQPGSTHQMGRVRFFDKHPSSLTCGNGIEEELPRPMDLLLLPIPDHGLFSGGLLKLLRTVQLNSSILASDAVVFPSSISIFAQVVELPFAVPIPCGAGEKGEMRGEESANNLLDCSSALSLLPPASFGAPLPINLAKIPHRHLCDPVLVASVDLATVLRSSSSIDPCSHFQSSVAGVSVTTPGHASAIVWWWSCQLCQPDRPSLRITNAPGSLSSPWATQDIEYIRECPWVDKDELITLSMTPSESELRLSWQLDTKVPWKPDVERHDPLPKFDAHWVMAWGKLTKQQLQIEEAIVQDPMLLKQVMQVAECIALDPAGIPIQCDGFQIELADASDLALSFRAGF